MKIHSVRWYFTFILLNPLCWQNVVWSQLWQGGNFIHQTPWWQRSPVTAAINRPNTAQPFPISTTNAAIRSTTTPSVGESIRTTATGSDRTAATFRPTTRPTTVEETSFEKPDCFAQPKCTPQRSQRYPFIAGICNNPIDGNRGRVGRPYRRLLPPDYGDDKGSPRLAKDGHPLPSARKISRSLNLDDRQIRSATIARIMPWWGQFVTHETTKALRVRKPSGATFSCACENPEDGCHNIELSKDDIRYIKEAELCIEVERTQHVPNPECDKTIREQKNSVSSYLDGGTVYGDSESDFDQLLNYRSDIGELLTGKYADADAENAGLPLQSQVHRDFGGRVQCEAMIHKPAAKPCMLAGDTRANENTALSAAHVVLLRKHNMLVKELAAMNPNWDRITLAQEAKKIITAIIQQITYREFLPVILDAKYINRFNLALMKQGYWNGYDASVDATLSNSFAAAAFRFGHTTLTKFFSRTSPDWRTEEADPLRVKDSFFNNEPLLEPFQGGVNSIIRGLAKDATQLTGIKMVEDLREFLFAVTGRPGKDLFAINIQRGRDHGIPGYNDFREMCGLNRAKDFSDLPEIPKNLQQKLESLYKHVDDIDLYVGGLAEDIDGGAVGPTYACIIGYQFRDLRFGDRFWFENGGMASSFSQEQLESIRKYSLSRLLCDTMSDLRTIQPKPMLLASVVGNSRKYCGEYETLDLNPWSHKLTTASRLEPEIKDDTEWSIWLPCVDDEGEAISVSTTLNDALRFRAADLCRDIISTQIRTINSVEQVRVECPAGSIRKTDFPYIDSGYEVYWTFWKDDADPDDGDDVELPPDASECKRPLSIQVQTINGIPSTETGQVFAAFGPEHGFICRGKHQSKSACQDYRVRYLCRKSSKKNQTSTDGTSKALNRKPQRACPTTITTTVPPQTTTSGQKRKNRGDPNKIVWTPWSNTDTPAGDGDNELISNVADKPGFCKNPLYIEARVARLRRPARSSGDVLDRISHLSGLVCKNYKQSRNICYDYEVRYLCRNGDINEDDAVPPSVEEKTKEFCQSYGICC